MRSIIQRIYYFCQYAAMGVTCISLVIGINSSEFIGNLYLGLVVASFFIVFMVVFSVFISELLFNKARLVWGCFSLSILLITLVYLFVIENEGNTSDIALAIEIPMMILSMPSGIFGLFFYYKFEFFKFEMIYANLMISWVISFVVGYAQWFVIYPKLIKLFQKVKTRKIK